MPNTTTSLTVGIVVVALALVAVTADPVEPRPAREADQADNLVGQPADDVQARVQRLERLRQRADKIQSPPEGVPDRRLHRSAALQDIQRPGQSPQANDGLDRRDRSLDGPSRESHENREDDDEKDQQDVSDVNDWPHPTLAGGTLNLEALPEAVRNLKDDFFVAGASEPEAEGSRPSLWSSTDSMPVQYQATVPASGIDVLELVTTALREGRVPKALSVSAAVEADKGAFHTAFMESAWSDLDNFSHLKSGNVIIEFGYGEMAYQFASQHDMHVITVLPEQHRTRYEALLSQLPATSRPLVIYVEQLQLPATLKKWAESPQVHFEVAAVTNLTVLTDGLLPHETSQCLARMASMSDRVVLVRTHTARLTRFWGSSIRRLLEDSISNKDMVAKVQEDYSSDLTWLQVFNTTSNLRSSVCRRAVKWASKLSLFLKASDSSKCRLIRTTPEETSKSETKLAFQGSRAGIKVHVPRGLPLSALQWMGVERSSSSGLIPSAVINVKPQHMQNDTVLVVVSAHHGIQEEERSIGTFAFTGPSWDADTTEAMNEEDIMDFNSVRHGRSLLWMVEPAEVEHHYDQHWEKLQGTLDNLIAGYADSGFSFLAAGDTLALSALKLCQRYNKAVGLFIASGQHGKTVQRRVSKIASSIGLTNLALAADGMGAAKIRRLAAMPDVAAFQLIGYDIVSTLLHRTNPEMDIARLLLSARQTIFEMPSPALLSLATSSVLGESLDDVVARLRGIFQNAARLTGAASYNLRFVALTSDREASGTAAPFGLVVVSLTNFQKPVHVCGEDAVLYVSDVDVQLGAAGQHPGHATAIEHATKTWSLQAIIAADPSPELKKWLLRLYLDLHTDAEDMCPAFITWDGRKLNHAATLDKDLVDGQEGMDVADALVQELQLPFSFLEWGGGLGNISRRVASTYPSSTVLTLESDRTLADLSWKAIEAEQLFNNIVGTAETSRTVLNNFFESPEFLRYQFMSKRHLLDLLSGIGDGNGLSTGDLKRLLGLLLVNGVSTFVQVPSAKQLSLAFHTFFPNAALKYHGEQVSFSTASHPSKAFLDADRRLLHSAQLRHAKVAELVSSVVESSKPSDAWQLLRFDLRNFTTTVNHHFNYRMDGHDRRYELHCESSSRQDWRVYLVREQDKFHIPYETVESVTLIALLRLGLLTPIRDRFYDMVLKMGLYEDMAPWNIAFKGGKLIYIDYDTRDNEMSRLLPFAYQLMAALMNFERTINDFGHCNGHAGNNYNIPFISHCVRSSYDGPCKDDKYPVPCGDRTCRETYVECLNALNEIDKKRAKDSEKMAQGPVESMKLNALLEFDEKGEGNLGFIQSEQE